MPNAFIFNGRLKRSNRAVNGAAAVGCIVRSHLTGRAAAAEVSFDHATPFQLPRSNNRPIGAATLHYCFRVGQRAKNDDPVCHVAKPNKEIALLDQ
jgi:hypothetical protein